MKIKPEHLEQLQLEVQHIFDGGANEIRVYNMIQAFIEKRGKTLFIPIVSTRFELGKRVKIDRCIYGHNFEIGQTVEIVDHEASQTTSWLCTDGINSWWLSEEEGNVC